MNIYFGNSPKITNMYKILEFTTFRCTYTFYFKKIMIFVIWYLRKCFNHFYTKIMRKLAKKMLTLEAKLEIVKQLQNGGKIPVLTKRHNMNKSNIRRIKNKLNVDKFRSS